MRAIVMFYLLIVNIELNAQTPNSLIVYLNSGSKVTFPVEQRPAITFEGNVLCINTDRYQLTDVKKYTFSENEAVGLEVVETDGENVPFSTLEDGKVLVEVKDASTAVRVYSSKGTEVSAVQKIQPDGKLLLDLNGLPPDVYVLSVGNETLKIRNK